jgi:hypothetical protein
MIKHRYYWCLGQEVDAVRRGAERRARRPSGVQIGGCVAV